MYVYMFTYVQMQQCRMTSAEWSKHLKRAGVDTYLHLDTCLHRSSAHNTPCSTPRSLVKTPTDSPSLHSRVPSMYAESMYAHTHAQTQCLPPSRVSHSHTHSLALSAQPSAGTNSIYGADI